MFRLPLPLPFILGLLTDLCENCSVAAYRGECMHDSLFFFHKSRVGMSRSYYMKMRAVASVDCLSALRSELGPKCPITTCLSICACWLPCRNG